MTNRGAKLNRIKIAVFLTALSVVAVSCWNTGSPGDKNDGLTISAGDRNGLEVSQATDKKYGRFSHTVTEHEEISCNECHGRKGTKLEYAGHSSCIDCHFKEFVQNDSQVCSICHTESPAKPEEMLAFPVKFNEGFNMMFDHEQHSKGNAKPAQGCAACHSPKSSTQTIPAGIATHSQCFTCHTQESGIGSCSTCHEIAPYTRTTARKSPVLNYVFSHADHTSKQGVSCSECHTAKAGAPQGKQILFPVAVQHFAPRDKKGAVTCASCHDNRRAFGERDFADCKRCHTGAGFTLMPGGKTGR